MLFFSQPPKIKLGLREAGVHLAPCNSLSGIINATGDVWGEGDSSWVAHLWGHCLLPPHLLFPNSGSFPQLSSIILPTLPQVYRGHQNNDLSNVSLFFYSSVRAARSDQPGQHVLYELYRPGADTHTLASWLFPVWPTQVRDAEQLLFGVRDVPAFSGGNVDPLWKTTKEKFLHRMTSFLSSSTQATGPRTSPSDFSIWCGLMLVTWLDMSSRMPTSF